MNKSDLVQAIADRQNITTKDATEIVNTIITSMADSLENGDNIELRGFGSFKIREYKSYVGRNPKTGERITVRPKRSPYFKPGKDLRNSVNRFD
mgnify:CR=1 FL=1